jgi:DNA polymerase-3 subunit beta
MSTITVDVSILRDVVSIADSFVGKKREGGAAMLRFVATKNGLAISAIGSESQLLVQRIACVCSGAAFESLIPPKRFGQILQTVREESVMLTAEKNSVTVKTSSSKFRLATEAFDTFPAIDQVVPDHSEAEIVVSELTASLLHTSPVCDETSVRYALGGVLLDLSDKGTNFVATDSRRMMVSARPNVKIVGPPLRFILPSAMARSMLSLLKRYDQSQSIKLRMNHNRMSVSGDSFDLVTPSVEGRFPVWQSLMTAANGSLVLEATAGDIKRACRLANVMTDEENQGVRFAFGDKVELSSGAKGGDSAVTLTGTIRNELKTEMMGKYILDAVSGWQDHEIIEWRQQNGDEAMYLHLPDSMICCIMPLVTER